MKNFMRWLQRSPENKSVHEKHAHTIEGRAEHMLSPVLMNLVEELQQLAVGRAEELLSQLCVGLRSGSKDVDRYRAAENLTAALYPKFKFSEYGRLFLEDRAFLAYYRRFMDAGNWHSLDRKYTLNQLLKLALPLAGDMAECGAYKGMSAYLMCQALQSTGRLVHLFDSFEGLPAPSKWDGDYWTSGALRIPESTLRETLKEFDNYRVYAGWIPERFAEAQERHFCFIHIDVDLYQPTLDSLEFFYPRMCTGGIILMDDYGFTTCPGAKRAADGFFTDKTEPIIMLTTGQALVIKQ